MFYTMPESFSFEGFILKPHEGGLKNCFSDYLVYRIDSSLKTRHNINWLPSLLHLIWINSPQVSIFCHKQETMETCWLHLFLQ